MHLYYGFILMHLAFLMKYGSFCSYKERESLFFEFLFKMADEGAFITPLQCGRLRPLWFSFFVAFQTSCYRCCHTRSCAYQHKRSGKSSFTSKKRKATHSEGQGVKNIVWRSLRLTVNLYAVSQR